VLFEADQRGLNVTQALDARIADPGVATPLPEYAIQIVRGVVDHWNDIEVAMAAHSEGWTIARMPAVDRAALRLATWEILFNDDVPAAVAIDQAVDLVTDLSTDESPGFVNGVLGAIAASAHRNSNQGASASGASDASLGGEVGGPLH
jgi:N utilization substance protein B